MMGWAATLFALKLASTKLRKVGRNSLPPEEGATVTCDVHALNGKQLKVTVTATNVTGDTVDYEITGIA